MTNDECFDAWAPPGARWSLWAKPVLFAQRSEFLSISEEMPGSREIRGLFRADGHTAVVVDLHGLESLGTGLALARLGYRPVPLFNTSPGPSAVIDVDMLTRALGPCASVLSELHVKDDAPPAFLIDARRMKPESVPAPSRFDNRWLVFPQDFPSGVFLRTHGVWRVVVIQDDEHPQADLSHVLLRWQEAGLQISVSTPDTGIRDYHVKRPSWFRIGWYRLIAMVGLRRNNAGGFGAVIPQNTGGGFG